MKKAYISPLAEQICYHAEECISNVSGDPRDNEVNDLEIDL